MTDIQSIIRERTWYGGITNNERDSTPGVALNVEEFDIWENEAYIRPTTIFAADSVIVRKITGYAADPSDNLYALGRTDAGGTAVQLFKKTTAGANTPGAWNAATLTGESGAATDYSPLEYGEENNVGFIYYISGTNSLVKHNLTDTQSSVGTLSGLGASFIRVPKLKMFGDSYWGHGQFIAKIDNGDGTFTQKKFTLPNGWEVIDMAPSGIHMAILARSTSLNENFCTVFYWDLVETSGPFDQIDLPTGGPQMIVNFNNGLWALCAKNGKLIIYIITADGVIEFPTKIDNIKTETDTQAIIPTASKFVKDNTLYFGLWKTDKTAMYSIGRVNHRRPYGITLGKRFSTSSYITQKPFAAIAVGPNFYANFDENGTPTNVKLEGNNSPTRSSKAVIETIYMDNDLPEFIKGFEGWIARTSPIPANCSIASTFRTDKATSYDSASNQTLDNSNSLDKPANITADTNYYRQTKSLVGAALQHKMSFTSSSTNDIKLYNTAYMYRRNKIA